MNVECRTRPVAQRRKVPGFWLAIERRRDRQENLAACVQLESEIRPITRQSVRNSPLPCVSVMRCNVSYLFFLLLLSSTDRLSFITSLCRPSPWSDPHRHNTAQATPVGTCMQSPHSYLHWTLQDRMRVDHWDSKNNVAIRSLRLRSLWSHTVCVYRAMIMTANRYRVSVHVTEQAFTGNKSRLLPLPSKLRIGSQTENVQFGLVITMPVRDAHPPGLLVKDERTIIQ